MPTISLAILFDLAKNPIMVKFTNADVTGENPGMAAPDSRISLKFVPIRTVTYTMVPCNAHAANPLSQRTPELLNFSENISPTATGVKTNRMQVSMAIA